MIWQNSIRDELERFAVPCALVIGNARRHGRCMQEQMNGPRAQAGARPGDRCRAVARDRGLVRACELSTRER